MNKIENIYNRLLSENATYKEISKLEISLIYELINFELERLINFEFGDPKIDFQIVTKGGKIISCYKEIHYSPDKFKSIFEIFYSEEIRINSSEYKNFTELNRTFWSNLGNIGDSSLLIEEDSIFMNSEIVRMDFPGTMKNEYYINYYLNDLLKKEIEIVKQMILLKVMYYKNKQNEINN